MRRIPIPIFINVSNATFFDDDGDEASCAPPAGSPYQRALPLFGREADVAVDVGVDVATSTNCVVNVLCTVMLIWMCVLHILVLANVIHMYVH